MTVVSLILILFHAQVRMSEKLNAEQDPAIAKQDRLENKQNPPKTKHYQTIGCVVN